MEVINENMRYIRKQLGHTQQEFADLLNIKRSSLGAYEEGRAKPNYDVLLNIAAQCGLTVDRLMTEKLSETIGKVFSPNNSAVLGDTSAASRPSSPDIRVLAQTTNHANEPNVELVSAKARARESYLGGYGDPEYLDTLQKIHIPFLEKKGVTYRAFEIEGDSMLPLPSGAIVIGEYVEDFNDIKNGMTYIVVSYNDGIVYKRLYNNLRASGTLALHSDNPLYPPYTMPAEGIAEVWQAKSYISREMPTPGEVSLERLYSMVLELQQEVIRLKSDKYKR